MRTFMLAVTGLVFAVAACSSYGTSVVEVGKTRAQVASVSLTVPSSLLAGQTARATAIPKDANGTALTDRQVMWYTSSESIASVSDSGMISAVAPGTAVVSAVSEGVSGQATMAVMPPPPTPIATVTVAVKPSAVLVGQTAIATATLEDSSGSPISGRTVTWESSDISVATVDTSGKVKGTGPGSARIKASSSGKSNSSVLSVSAPSPVPVASVSVSPTSASLQVGASVQLSAVTFDSANNVLTGRVISWSSANTGIATVSGSGLVSAVAAGSVSITVSSEGQTASAAITVSAPAPVPVASVSVTPATASLLVGATVQLSAVTRDANNNVLTGRIITWSSSNPAVSTVSTSGLVTAIAAGSATLTATSETKTGTSAITATAGGGTPGWRGNEPSAMTFIDERAFNSLTENDAPHAPYWLSSGGTIVQDATAPQSPSNVIRATYPAGASGGSGPMSTLVEGQGISNRVFYVSWYGKYSSNFYGHLTGVNKQSYFGANGGVGQVYFEAYGVGTNPLTPNIVLQAGLSTDGVFGPNLVPSTVVPRNQWFYIEIVLTGNTSGNADGSVDWFINGVHVGNRSGLRFTTTATSWDRFQFDPIWGGLGDTVPATMTLDIDHIYLSGKN
jgi:uncharacterized protein YjdB